MAEPVILRDAMNELTRLSLRPMFESRRHRRVRQAQWEKLFNELFPDNEGESKDENGG